jgi:uncharacterized protein YdhG (YjbR/CyaY superfamily)
MKKSKDVDEYLARLSADKRVALQRLRKIIHAAVPGAVECISYRIPAVRYRGKVLVWFAAATHHCSFFPGAVVQDFEADLKGFTTGRGTVRFTPDHPLPVTLVRKLLRARIAQHAAPHGGGRTPARRKARKAARRR